MQEKDHILLCSGNITARFENGFLRYIKVGDEEVLRMINFAVRDANWGTIPQQVQNEHLEYTASGFELGYECICQEGEIDFRWRCKISGLNNSLGFEIEGEAHSVFDANRIGFFVLHPIDTYAGRSIKIVHPDSSNDQGEFPKHIAPHQLFKNIRRMEMETDHALIQLYFEGEIFETEDQRNWLDASYKTYCTPLELPFPITKKVGDKVCQKIKMTVEPKSSFSPSIGTSTLALQETGKASPLPKLGLEANLLELTAWSCNKLKELRLSFLRVELRVNLPDWKSDFESRMNQAEKLLLPVELVIFTPPNINFLKKRLATIDWQRTEIRNVLLLEGGAKATSRELMVKTLPVIREVFGNIPVGSGTDYYFAQINRKNPPAALLDFYSFSANPQVHAFDDLTIFENTQTFEYVVKSAQRLSGGKPLHISPITLKPRSNPDATRKISPEEQEKKRLDHRHNQPFNALWTLAVLKQLAQAGIAQATFFQTVGKEGVLDENKKEIFPVYEVFAFLARHSNAQIVHTRSSHPLIFEGLVVSVGANKYYALVNFSKENIRIQLDGQTVVLQARELKFME